jgi:hypothetical protein
MSHNPFAGHVPLNYRQGVEDKVAKSVENNGTSYRSGEYFNPEYRTPQGDSSISPRNDGCTPLRRYPNGVLDFRYVAMQVVDIIHKIQDNGFLTNFEKALLSLILPDNFRDLIDSKIAQTMTKLSLDERMVVARMVDQHMRAETNWNVGRGGGSVPGREKTRV